MKTDRLADFVMRLATLGRQAMRPSAKVKTIGGASLGQIPLEALLGLGFRVLLRASWLAKVE